MWRKCLFKKIEAATERFIGDINFPDKWNIGVIVGGSGTGKSTHTQLWLKHIEGTDLMNDDNPVVRFINGETIIYGSPWSGKHGLANNVCVPLKGICLLHRGTENVIRQAEKQDLTEMLCKQVHLPENEILATKVLALVDTLAERVPLWEMACNKELEAAKIAYAAMNWQGK